MLGGGGIIRTAMKNRKYKHRRTDDQFSIPGEYTRNLQYVYSKEIPTKAGLVVDLVYFAVNMVDEKLVIGLYRENPAIENGVYINRSEALPLQEFSREALEEKLDKLIPDIKEKWRD